MHSVLIHVCIDVMSIVTSYNKSIKLANKLIQMDTTLWSCKGYVHFMDGMGDGHKIGCHGCQGWQRRAGISANSTVEYCLSFFCVVVSAKRFCTVISAKRFCAVISAKRFFSGKINTALQLRGKPVIDGIGSFLLLLSVWLRNGFLDVLSLTHICSHVCVLCNNQSHKEQC